MDLGLDKKIIIVTGGSKGIGSGIVSILAEEGAIPIIIGRNQNSILKSVSNYRKKGYEVGYAFAELSDPEQCDMALDEILTKYETIHGLVNNAGINDGVSLEKGTHNDFLNSLNNNLVHYFKMSQLVLPELK